MSDLLHIPQTLHEAIKHFSDPAVAHHFFVTLRWPGGVICPYCSCDRLSYISTRRNWACKECKKMPTLTACNSKSSRKLLRSRS